MLLPEIVLPWPVTACWPNRRAHYMALHRARKGQRERAFWEARARGWRRHPNAVSVEITLTFCPPSRRSYDADNALAAMKGALDGLSDALGVDDQHFMLTPRRGDTSKNGGVIVRAEVQTARGGISETGDNWRRIDGLAADVVADAVSKMMGKDAAE